MYNKSKRKQLGVCGVTIRHKSKGKLCRFIVAPGGSLALLGMPDIEMHSLLSVKCITIEPRRHVRKINGHSMENKSCTNKN